jgi:hypothetical protein
LVSVNGGTLVINTGAKLEGNRHTASSYNYGGGVYVSSSGGSSFTKLSGGTIYGSDADSALKNTAKSGDAYGHAVYVSSSKKRNTTAGVEVRLNSEVSGSAGGWE